MLSESNNAGLSIPIGTTVDEATKRLVQATVEHCAGNKLKAARMLGHFAAHDVSAFFKFGISGVGQNGSATLTFWHKNKIAHSAHDANPFKTRAN